MKRKELTLRQKKLLYKVGLGIIGLAASSTPTSNANDAAFQDLVDKAYITHRTLLRSLNYHTIHYLYMDIATVVTKERRKAKKIK